MAGLLALLVHPLGAEVLQPGRLEGVERLWYRASGLLLSRRVADGSWNAGLDPALSGLIGAPEGGFTTTLGRLEAKQASAQSGWCRAFACLLDSVGLDIADTVALTMSSSFPGLNLAVLLTLEAAGIPYRAVASLGASSFGANLPGWSWPRIERLLKDRGILQGGSAVITPGGSGDRFNGLPLENRWLLMEELQGLKGVYHPASLREAVELRRRVLGDFRRISLFVNIGGGHAALGGNHFGRAAGGGILGEEERALLRGTDQEPGQEGLMQHYFSMGIPVINFTEIQDLAVAWGLPLRPAEAMTPPELRVGCSRIAPDDDRETNGPRAGQETGTTTHGREIQ